MKEVDTVEELRERMEEIERKKLDNQLKVKQLLTKIDDQQSKTENLKNIIKSITKKEENK